MNVAATTLDVALLLLALPVLLCSAYLFALTLLSSRLRAPAEAAPRLRFDIVVPAHDEEAGIAATVASLLAVDWPAELRRIVVVADNCTDATAARAMKAGAQVLVRVDPDRRGKGYALAHAFERSLADGVADAVVVIDADTTVSRNLLHAFASRIELGAHALQAEYGVRNPRASWRTRLMVIALAIFHVLRSRARERLRVSAGLRGNGMCFTTRTLREVPHDAFSVVEDLEYGIRLGRANHRVWYAMEAHVLGDMVASEKASRSQRTRWEAGRLAIARLHGKRLLLDAVRERSALLLDLAVDVLVPPLSYVFAAAAFGLALAGARVIWFTPTTIGWAVCIPWATALLFIFAYVLRGVALAGLGPRGLLDLLWAPVYIVWKLALSVRQRRLRKDEWIRTTREKT